jgi:hypothetical protein
MRVFSRAITISMTDLMCCSFGAAFLLVLIISAANPEQKGAPRNSKSSVMVRCYHLKGPKAEIRLEYRSPGQVTWQQAEGLSLNGIAFSASAERSSGAEALIVLFDPAEGLWEFRASVVGFPQDGAPWEQLTLAFEVSGDRLTTAIHDEPDQLVVWPGDRTPAVGVRVVAE